MSKNVLSAALAFALWTEPATAQDRLEPVRSSLGAAGEPASNAGLRESFPGLFFDGARDKSRPRPVAHMLVTTAHAPYAVALRAVGSKMDLAIWETQDRGAPALLRCHRPLATDLAGSFVDAWRSVLIRTRYERGEFKIIVDGAVYHFTATGWSPLDKPDETSWPLMEGTIHSPPRESLTGRLVALAQGLREACADQDSGRIDNLADDARILAAAARSLGD